MRFPPHAHCDCCYKKDRKSVGEAAKSGLLGAAAGKLPGDSSEIKNRVIIGSSSFVSKNRGLDVLVPVWSSINLKSQKMNAT